MPTAQLCLLVALGASALDEDPKRASFAASGVTRPAQVLDQRLEDVVRDAVERSEGSGPPKARLERLLAGLHAPRGPLTTYDEDATTLVEALGDGRFNCVSSTVLFLLAAEEAGFEVRAELLPTHARALARLDGRWVRVETTSPHGVDPTTEERRGIAARVVPGADRSIVEARGARGDLSLVLAAMLANRATLAQRSGELKRAERLFAESEALLDSTEARAAIRNQRVSLLLGVAYARLDATELSSLEAARTETELAVEIGAASADLRARAQTSLRVVGERLVAAHLARGSETKAARVVAELGPRLHGDLKPGLQAYHQAHLASARFEGGRREEGLAAAWRAAALDLPPDESVLAESIEKNLAGMGITVAGERASADRLEDALELLDRLERRVRARADWTRERSRAYRLASQARSAKGDLEGAIAALRAARRDRADDAEVRHNLSALLQRWAVPRVESAQCAPLEPVLEEIATLGGERFAYDADLSCLMRQAKAEASGGAWTEALALLDRREPTFEGDERFRQMLRYVSLGSIDAAVRSGRCPRARQLFRRAKSRGLEPGPRALGTCKAKGRPPR